MKTASARTLGTILALGLMLLACSAAYAQSGHGAMSGYVAFQDTAYRSGIHARVELLGIAPGESPRYRVDTDDSGIFKFEQVGGGEYRLRISAPGFRTYETRLYIPSDFLGNLAVILKKNRSGKASAAVPIPSAKAPPGDPQ